MNNKIKQIVSLSLVLLAVSVMAKENVYNPGATSVVNTKVAAGCDPSSSQTDLDVNNVRTTIMGGGDMWWNLTDARYEIPKNEAFDIDDPEDFELGRHMYEYQMKQNQ